MKKTMSLALMVVLCNLVALSLVGLAAYLIYLNRSGWGWVLFAAVLSSSSISYKTMHKQNAKSMKA